MGELHLEVTRERLRREYGVDVAFGRMDVAYRERPSEAVEGSGDFDRMISGTRHAFRATVQLTPISEEGGNIESRSELIVGSERMQLDSRLMDEEVAARAVAGKNSFLAAERLHLPKSLQLSCREFSLACRVVKF